MVVPINSYRVFVIYAVLGHPREKKQADKDGALFRLDPCAECHDD